MIVSVQHSLTLRWLEATYRQTPELIEIMREEFAKHLGVPVTANERFESPEELAWVYAKFGRDICAFSGVKFPQIVFANTRTF